MPAEKKRVHSPADLLRSMDALADLQRGGVGDFSNALSKTLEAFDQSPCETIEDALAFLSASHRLQHSLILEGNGEDSECAEMADRYWSTAVAFLRGEDMRRKHGHFGGRTLH
jgi:hypothetical protein